MPYPCLRLDEEPGQEVVGLLPRLADLWCGGLAQDKPNGLHQMLSDDLVVLRPHVCEDVLVGDPAQEGRGASGPTDRCLLFLSHLWMAGSSAVRLSMWKAYACTWNKKDEKDEKRVRAKKRNRGEGLTAWATSKG